MNAVASSFSFSILDSVFRTVWVIVCVEHIYVSEREGERETEREREKESERKRVRERERERARARERERERGGRESDIDKEK